MNPAAGSWSQRTFARGKWDSAQPCCSPGAVCAAPSLGCLCHPALPGLAHDRKDCGSQREAQAVLASPQDSVPAFHPWRGSGSLQGSLNKAALSEVSVAVIAALPRGRASCTLGQAGHCQGQQQWPGSAAHSTCARAHNSLAGSAVHRHVQDGVYKGIALLGWRAAALLLPHPSLPGSSSRRCKSHPTQLSPPGSVLSTLHTRIKKKLRLLIIFLN